MSKIDLAVVTKDASKLKNTIEDLCLGHRVPDAVWAVGATLAELTDNCKLEFTEVFEIVRAVYLTRKNDPFIQMSRKAMTSRPEEA